MDFLNEKMEGKHDEPLQADFLDSMGFDGVNEDSFDGGPAAAHDVWGFSFDAVGDDTFSANNGTPNPTPTPPPINHFPKAASTEAALARGPTVSVAQSSSKSVPDHSAPSPDAAHLRPVPDLPPPPPAMPVAVPQAVLPPREVEGDVHVNAVVPEGASGNAIAQRMELLASAAASLDTKVGDARVACEDSVLACRKMKVLRTKLSDAILTETYEKQLVWKKMKNFLGK